MKDSIQIYAPIDTTSITIQNINNQFTKTDKTVGSGLIGLWIVGLIITMFVFKRPNR